ncbi:BMC domain-containing protein [Desulforhopalus sp. 52FAK]
MKKVKSIGLIETLGIVTAIEAADTALKAANVECLGYELNKAGYVTIKLSGDIAAVQAAVSSGAATAERLGNLVATHVIARPDEQLVNVFVHSADNVPSVIEPDSSSDGSEGKEGKFTEVQAVKTATHSTPVKQKPTQKKTTPKTVQPKSTPAKTAPSKTSAAKPVEPKTKTPSPGSSTDPKKKK